MLDKVPHPLDGVELMEDTMREAKHGVSHVYDDGPSFGCNSSQCRWAGDCYCP